MIKQNIKFVTTGQFVTFYNTCRNLSANITVKDIENHRMNINGKELILNPGDSLYFDSAQPHGMMALDGKTVKFLAVIM